MFTNEGYSVNVFRVCFKRKGNGRVVDKMFEEIG